MFYKKERQVSAFSEFYQSPRLMNWSFCVFGFPVTSVFRFALLPYFTDGLLFTVTVVCIKWVREKWILFRENQWVSSHRVFGHYENYSWNITKEIMISENLEKRLLANSYRYVRDKMFVSVFVQVSCGFRPIYWRNPSWKTSFFVQCEQLILAFWKTVIHIFILFTRLARRLVFFEIAGS